MAYIKTEIATLRFTQARSDTFAAGGDWRDNAWAELALEESVGAELPGCRLSLTATIYNIHIDLADADRSVYESLALRVARHPSESEEYLVTRVLAYALEFTEGIAFSAGGLSDPDAPPITVRDLTGAVTSWIEIGSPDAGRLHRASKAAPRVAVYTHKDIDRLVQNLGRERIHRVEALELYAIDRALVASAASRLDRRMAFTLSVSDRELFVSIGVETLTGRVSRHFLSP